MIPLFDSLTHPTLQGNWLDRDTVATFEDLKNQMDKSNVSFAIACGINGNAYSHERYYLESTKIKGLVPIARLDMSVKDIEKEIERISEIGFKGIKIHPRFENFDYSEDILARVFIKCQDLGIVVHWCSFYYSKIENYPSFDPYFSIIRTLKKAPKTTLVIVHGGVHDIMKYAELARFNDNILIDLSLTLFQYRNTTHYQNIIFLLSKIDRRLCLGSDHPEVSLMQLREQFDEFCAMDIPVEKLWNIGIRNISKKYNIEI